MSLRPASRDVMVLAQRRDALAGDDFGQLDGGLVEGVDAHQARGENRFQHEVHHQRPDAALVEAGEIEGAGGCRRNEVAAVSDPSIAAVLSRRERQLGAQFKPSAHRPPGGATFAPARRPIVAPGPAAG